MVSSSATSKGITIKRFRMDALVICITGTGLCAVLVYLLVQDSISPAFFLIPFLFGLACAVLGFHTLRRAAFEHVHVNWNEKRLVLFTKGLPVQQLTLSSIDMLYTSGGLYKTMLVKLGKEHVELFQSFFFTRRFYRFAAAMGGAGVPLAAQLKQHIIMRAKNVWRGFIIVLFAVSSFIILYVLLGRA